MTLKQFCEPYDWSEIDAEVADTGAVILTGFLGSSRVDTLNADVENYLQSVSSVDGQLPGLPATGSSIYNQFLGYRTLRLHGLLEKLPAVHSVLGSSSLLGWAERLLGPVATQPRLSAAELIQIQPGEPRQAAHRDSDSWPLPIGDAPFVVNAIIALSDFTATNGGTWVAPGSWRWPADRTYSSSDFVQSQMSAGDALLFRGDLVHGAGANDSDAHRRALSISFCAGWLRGVENCALNLSLQTVRGLSRDLQAVLGFAAYDGSARGTGLLGLYENGDPAQALVVTDVSD